MHVINTRISILITILLFDCNYAQNWTYFRDENDKQNWGGLCDSGKRQSPTNIIPSFVDSIDLPRLSFSNYDVRLTVVRMINNGYTIEVSNFVSESVSIYGGPLPTKYFAKKVELHWHSEHAINGESFPLEVQIVHCKDGTSDLQTALAETNGVAIISILYDYSDSNNKGLQHILDQYAFLTEETIVKYDSFYRNEFTLQDLLPANLSYYTYQGSMTVPNCSESVLWIIFCSPDKISRKSLKLLQSIKNFEKKNIQYNYRSLQKLNSRNIKMSYNAGAQTYRLLQELLAIFSIVFLLKLTNFV